MKNYTLILLLAVLILTEMSAYSQTPITLETNRVTEKRYGISLSGRHLDFMYEFVYPTSDTLALPKIREQILEAFFGWDLPKDKLLGNFNDQLQFAQTWYEDNIIKNYTDAIPPPKGWGIAVAYDFTTSAVQNIHNKVLVFCIDEQYANGIAHGRHDCTCINYNLQTGDRISLNDLFDSNGLDEMNKIVNETLTPPEYYSVGTIENFMMLPKGVQFVYNEYVAGPYSAGVIRVTIPLSKFRHLLKDEALNYFEE